MGVKLGGFVCDNCRTFTTFGGVMSEPDIDIDNLIEGSEDNEQERMINSNLAYSKEPGWGYYNIIEVAHMDNNWIRWSKKSKCYCPKCDRMLKLEKLISKTKKHD